MSKLSSGPGKASGSRLADRPLKDNVFSQTEQGAGEGSPSSLQKEGYLQVRQRQKPPYSGSQVAGDYSGQPWMSTEDPGPQLPKYHLALLASLGKGGQHVATGPQCQEVLITLLVSPGSLRPCLGEGGGEESFVCLPDAAFLPVCESVAISNSNLA